MGDISNISITHLIDTDTIVKKDFHRFGGVINLPQCVGSNDIDVTVYVKHSTIQVSELVAFLGNVAHNGTKEQNVAVSATSYERFVGWLDISGESTSPFYPVQADGAEEDYLSKVPSERQPMMHVQGKVGGTKVPNSFTISGSIYMVCYFSSFRGNALIIRVRPGRGRPLSGAYTSRPGFDG
jgi:hypothetical protein